LYKLIIIIIISSSSNFNNITNFCN